MAEHIKASFRFSTPNHRLLIADNIDVQNVVANVARCCRSTSVTSPPLRASSYNISGNIKHCTVCTCEQSDFLQVWNLKALGLSSLVFSIIDFIKTKMFVVVYVPPPMSK